MSIKGICQKKEKQKYIVVGTVRMFIKSSTITRLTYSPYTTKIAKRRWKNKKANLLTTTSG